MPALRSQRLPGIPGAWARRNFRAFDQGVLPIAPLPDGPRSIVPASAQRVAGIVFVRAWQQHLRLMFPPYPQHQTGFRAGQCQTAQVALRNLPRWQLRQPREEEGRALLGSVHLAQREARGEMEADIPLLPVGRDSAVRGFVGSCPLPLVGAAHPL